MGLSWLPVPGCACVCVCGGGGDTWAKWGDQTHSGQQTMGPWRDIPEASEWLTLYKCAGGCTSILLCRGAHPARAVFIFNIINHIIMSLCCGTMGSHLQAVGSNPVLALALVGFQQCAGLASLSLPECEPGSPQPFLSLVIPLPVLIG